jgi:NAD+ kinase
MLHISQWRGLFEKVGIVSRMDKEDAIKLARRIYAYLREAGRKVVAGDKLAEFIPDVDEASDVGGMEADLIVVIGGDGTILRTCQKLPKPEPPLLTINMGVRGFLADVEPERAIEALDKCLKGEFELESCPKIYAEVNGRKLREAINEYLLASASVGKMIHAALRRGEEEVCICRADGIVMASPVGSTAHSLSGGGPIIDPDLEAFVFTPLCPVVPIRPVVFPKGCEASLSILRPRLVSVIIDGFIKMRVKSGVTIRFGLSENKINFVRPFGTFYDRLRNRLLFWG